jgi:hypothetical protein
MPHATARNANVLYLLLLLITTTLTPLILAGKLKYDGLLGLLIYGLLYNP